jgi:hypothetical protein
MARDNSYKITEKQYNYLLPVFGLSAKGVTKLHTSRGQYYFIGTYEEHKDMLNRCKYL